MKIEKISDTQIRCTLNKEDLADRHLRLSELAYGSDKAKALFRDMMQQANSEFGFDAENIPIMVEAIPISADCLILQITKVENPDELDTRFSSFTPDEDSEEKSLDSFDTEEETDTYADEILNCFEQFSDMLEKRLSATDSSISDAKKKNCFNEISECLEEIKELTNKDARLSMTKAYAFQSLSSVTELAAVIAPFYNGQNTLYKNSADNTYHLVVEISSHKPADFNKICNIISEYASSERVSAALLAHFEEHMKCIVKDRAIQVLSKY